MGRLFIKTIVIERLLIPTLQRLLPAALLLLAAVAAYGWLAAPTDRLGTIRGDALATLAYVANWRFILDDASYFELWSEASPLRHMWSLAIEEQFYVLWPLVVLALLRAGRGRTGRSWRSARALRDHRRPRRWGPGLRLRGRPRAARPARRAQGPAQGGRRAAAEGGSARGAP